MSEWRKVELGDICSSIQTGPFGSQLHQSDYSTDGTPVVMPVNLIDGRINEDGIARVSEEHVERLSRHKAELGDIMYSRRGDVGRCSRVTSREVGWLCGTGCLRVTPNNKAVDSDFLYFALSQDKTIAWVQSHAIGATMPNLNTGILASVPLELPSLDEQQRIAGILAAYDKLIENSRKQIALLEEAADLLYEYWLANNNFSGSNKGVLSDCYQVSIGKTPPRSHTECFSQEGIPWASVKDLGGFQGVFLSKTNECLTEEAAAQYKCKILPKGTIFLSFKLTIGRVAIVEQPTASNEAIAHFYTDDEDLRLYTYEYLRHFDYDSLGSTSSIGKAINSKIVRDIPFPMPTKTALSSLGMRISPIMAEIGVLQKQSAVAREARDRLMPKLMSGEIQV